MLKKLLLFIFLFSTFIFLAGKESALGIDCTLYEFKCWQDGTTCGMTDCPSGCVVDNVGQPFTMPGDCQSGGVGACNIPYDINNPWRQPCKVLPTSNCPPDHPQCEALTLCPTTEISQTCSDIYTILGNCCTASTTSPVTCPISAPICTGPLDSEQDCLELGKNPQFYNQGCIKIDGTIGDCCYQTVDLPPDPDPTCGGYPDTCGCPCGSFPYDDFSCDSGYQLARSVDPWQCGRGYFCCLDSDPNCSKCTAAIIPSLKQKIFCDKSGGPSEKPEEGNERIYTAIGCIPVAGGQTFTEWVLGWAIGIAGGIAFILIIYSGFLIMTSAGNPKQVAAGKELLTAAVSGLILILLSAYLLEFIGVDILQLSK